MMIDKVTLENLDQIDERMFSDPSFFTKVEDFVYEIEAEGKPDSARVAFLALVPLLDKAQISKELSRQYLSVLCALRLISLSVVSDDEKRSFLNQNLVVLLLQDYADLKNWLNFIFNSYGYDEDISRNLQGIFVSAILECNNFIGTNDIQITTGTVKPVVKNWIYDYNAVARPNSPRGTIDEATYVNQAPNARSLSSHEKDLLRKVLRIYDWLRFEVPVKVRRTDSAGSISFTQPDIAPMPAIKSDEPQITAFEKKLSEITAQHKTEVDEPKAAPKVNTAQVEEIKREVNTKELPVHKEELLSPPAQPKKMVEAVPKMVIKPVAKPQPAPAPKPEPKLASPPASKPLPNYGSIRPEPKPIPEPMPQPLRAQTTAPIDMPNLDTVRTMEDLKKIEIAHLRQGPILNQIDLIKQKILDVIKNEKVMPYYAVSAFEQSPLFKSYLRVGNARVAGGDNLDLSPDEFEAIADLRKHVESF